MIQKNNIPTLTLEISLKYLHNLILHNIFELKHITCSNGTHPMNNDEFKAQYNKPTKTKKAALDYAKKFFCEPTCHIHCTHPCPTHKTPNTLKNEYIILNQNIHIRSQGHRTLLPPPHILKDPTHFPIHNIKNNRPGTYTYKYKITKKYMSYLCQWLLPNGTNYNKWLPQRELFP
jgi:hypothetical protein